MGDKVFRNGLARLDSSITDTLFARHKYIMGQLSSFESYDDPFIIFEVTPMVEDGGEVMEYTRQILSTLTCLEKGLTQWLIREMPR